MILGTAGHIDHGKTALVRALTGVDTDRLPEEKRRGITIDLGFAPLKLAGDLVLGVVDVPGHEAFVRTMLAGATGIDVAMLVIAADEGPMPQTREHLAILELLQVRRVVVALTKIDLVDADWLALVTEEVRELLKPTRYAGAEIIPTSVVANQGLDHLRRALTKLAESREPRAVSDLFRMPVDRAFSVKGTGTVVTGTVWSGSLATDQMVRVMPFGTTARVRSLQSHGEAVDAVTPGMRAAVALASVEASAVPRGSTLVTHPVWQPTQVVRADLSLLAEAPVLRPRTKVRFHLATSDVGARVVAVGAAVGPGESRPVRIVLDQPVMARAGDRFVLRSASPLATIGGGVVTDPLAARRSRPMEKLDQPAPDRLALFATEAGLHGVSEGMLSVRLRGDAPTSGTKAKASGVTRVGERWFSTEALEAARARIVSLVKAHHAERPLDPGAQREDVRSRLGVDQALFEQLIAELAARKKLETSGSLLRQPGRSAELTDAQQKVADDLLAAIQAGGREPPSVGELEERFGRQTIPVLRHLQRQQRVVQVEEARYYAPEAVRELLQRLEGAMAGKGEVAPTDLREALGFSRKFLIPFLEYCDKRGHTQRVGNGRIWKGVKL